MKKELVIRTPKRGYAEMLWRFTFSSGQVQEIGPWANLPNEESIAPAIGELRKYQSSFTVADERAAHSGKEGR